MALHGAVCRLVLVLAVGRHQHRGHHGKRSKCRGEHVAHHVAVVVLACPDEATLTLHDASHGVIDEGVEVRDARCLKALAVLVLVHVGEDVLEAVVVDL